MNRLRQALANYQFENKFNKTEAAKSLGAPRTTYQTWLLGVEPKGKYREMLSQKFPGVFSDDGRVQSDEELRKNESQITKCGDQLEWLIQVFFAEQYIASLSGILEKFLAGPAEARALFREKMGPKWNQFYEIVVPMVSERSRQLSIEEGKLEVK